MKRLIGLMRVVVIGVTLASCGSEKGAATSAIQAAETAWAAAKDNVAKIVPADAKSMDDAIAAAKASLEGGDAKAALAAAKDLPAKIQELTALVPAEMGVELGHRGVAKDDVAVAGAPDRDAIRVRIAGRLHDRDDLTRDGPDARRPILGPSGHGGLERASRHVARVRGDVEVEAREALHELIARERAGEPDDVARHRRCRRVHLARQAVTRARRPDRPAPRAFRPQWAAIRVATDRDRASGFGRHARCSSPSA